ncbi:DUF927 domain-containing protein [Turicibacter sanguinis]|uniref:DUF927 domain-containing protein n=1 Tax=Turicibacter sanguinis TaxID=154288 RepID=UPI001899CA9D|nr:DUF927 domain-containing protein [Turicibacter sanguinis]MDB8556541.1 DUF927 domain-containing protein [Turicibacter sanguinis]
MKKDLNTINGHLFIKDNKVYKVAYDKEDEPSYTQVSNYISVVCSHINIDTGTVTVTLEYQPLGINMSRKRKTVSADVIACQNKIESLSAYGIDVNSTNKFDLLKYLRDECANAPVYCEHYKLGFDSYEDQCFFKHNTSIGFNEESLYAGNLCIKPKGDYQLWLSMVKTEVLGNPPMELALLLGLSSALVGFISKDLCLESQFFHIFGESSTGKSTACALLASTFGSPNIREKGLVCSWNITPNALQGMLANNNGVPLVFEEASLANISDFSSIIYTVGEGKEKMRMNAELEIRDPRVWSTNVVSNGEFSLFEKSNNNTGLRVRLIEFDNIQFTTNALNAEKIKEVVSNNYGHCGPKFAEALLQIGKPKVITFFNNEKKRVRSLIPHSPISDRLSSKLAFITTTSKIAAKIFNLDFNTKAITDILIEQVARNIADGDLASQAFLNLLEYIGTNPNLFENQYFGKSKMISSGPHVHEVTAQSMSKYNGKLIFGGINSNELQRIIIYPNILKEILEKYFGFQSTTVILKEFKKRGWLEHEAGRLTSKRKLNGFQMRVYVIKSNHANNYIDKKYGSFSSNEVTKVIQPFEYVLDEHDNMGRVS